MLADTNPSGITPLGGHVVVTIEKSESEKRLKAMGLEMPGNSAERDKLAMQQGLIVAVAHDARFGVFDCVGKLALFGRYAGTTVKGSDGEDYRILFDEDVKGTLDA